MSFIPEKTDSQLAMEIRAKVFELHKAIREASDAGLKIKAELAGIGTPPFAYKDSVSIVRVL